MIGYPKWWGDRPRSCSSSARGRGRRGSNTVAGRGLGGGVSIANAVHVNGASSVETTNYFVSDKGRDGVSGISDSLWRVIKGLLNAGKSVEKKS